MTQLASARVTGAQQVHDKVPAKVHDDKVRDKARHGGTRRGRRGAARDKHAHGTTRHSSLEREENTRAEGHGDVFGSGAQVPPHAGAIPTRAKVTRQRRPRGGMRRRGDAEG
ncbi:unnamed protein product [Symbiodinium sp. CCMP2592]|nr:unnamed protein product [Symbiodinium sp. CCMP2592]